MICGGVGRLGFFCFRLMIWVFVFFNFFIFWKMSENFCFGSVLMMLDGMIFIWKVFYKWICFDLLFCFENDLLISFVCRNNLLIRSMINVMIIVVFIMLISMELMVMYNLMDVFVMEKIWFWIWFVVFFWILIFVSILLYFIVIKKRMVVMIDMVKIGVNKNSVSEIIDNIVKYISFLLLLKFYLLIRVVLIKLLKLI